MRAQKLLDEVAVRGVQFDAIGAGPLYTMGRLDEIFDQSLDLPFHCARVLVWNIHRPRLKARRRAAPDRLGKFSQLAGTVLKKYFQ